MQVRIWRRDGAVSDRPAELVPTLDGPMIQWAHVEGEPGVQIVEGVQLRNDDGSPLGEIDLFSPPWALLALLRDDDAFPPLFRCPLVTPILSA